MTRGYWSSVPKGVWTVTDTSDILQALQDEESRWVFIPGMKQWNIYGPFGKALIVDMDAIAKKLPEQDFKDFFNTISGF